MRASFFSLLTLLMGLSLSNAAPLSNSSSTHSLAAAAGSWWLPNVPQQGALPFGGNAAYKIYRNVKDYGAKGDGSSDDTQAINNAISDGNRCGQGCDSSTTSPALVYFPPGTYVVSAPIVQYYFTQLVGDAVSVPTLKAAPGFAGIAVIDSDPYVSGVNWYTNQNNFYRQVRNFVIDLTGLPQSTGTGIHWQVGQATSLQNIRFEMIKGGGGANKQQGIFMDNGSGSFMADLTFNGGNYGMFLGNQQFTTRNIIFNNVNTAVYMNYNWVWNFQGIQINNCGVGIDMAQPGDGGQAVGSIVVIDSKITGTPVGIRTAWSQTSTPPGAGQLVIDNVDFTGCQNAVADANGGTILAGGGVVQSWVQGRKYQGSSGSRVQGTQPAPSKPASLLDGSGKIYARSKPQYENVPAGNFVSIKSKGAKGDGSTDDTAAIQNAMNSVSGDQVLLFDYGAYIVSNTITVPNNIKIVGQLWPMIMASGSAFQDQNNPKPVFQVGQSGASGAVEMSDLVFQTVGPQVGAKLIEWNLGAASQGSNGMWDVHTRVGGSAGTNLQSDKCTNAPQTIAPANPACEGAFLLLHVTKTGSVYIENQWAWVADHELDRTDHNKLNIFNGRGVLDESTAPTWYVGHASEHSVLYNYNLHGAQNVYMGIAQTETPYFQNNPDATTPFTAQAVLGDPTFAECGANDPLCKKSWGLTMSGVNGVLVYGTGMYSFFDNWSQDCLNNQDCQTNMINVDNSQNVWMYAVNTKAAANMIVANGQSQAKDSDNRSTFCATVGLWNM